MKKSQSLRSVLGLSQDDLALILNVGRTRFAMYEAGSRNIPTASKRLLAEMIQYICGSEASPNSAGMVEQHAQKQNAVQRMLKENEYQRMATARKILRVEAKCTGNLKALRLVEFLGLREKTNDITKSGILRSIAYKATQSLKSQGLDLLFKLKLKLEMLELEKLLLDAEVRKLQRTSENIESKE